MSYSSNYVLNQRVSYLEWEVNQLNPPPGGYSLAGVLAIGNNAGANDIVMNNRNITDATIVETNTLQLTDNTNTVASTGSGGNLVSTSTNGDIIEVINTVGKFHQVQIPSGFPRLTVAATGVQINGIPLSFDSTNNLGIQPSGGFTVLTLASKNAGGAVQIAVANGSSVVSTPVIVNSATTTISNATTINTLASTTQPNGTNNTSVATTAFVQSAISAIPTPSTIIPYLYGFCPNQSLGASNFISINFTNGSTLNPNTYFTLRCQIQYTWTTTGGTGGLNGVNPYFTNYQFLMDVYPNRVPNITAGNNNALPNGTINGNASYVMTDPTYAPNGRWYWIRNYSSSTASPTSPTVINNPFYFLTLSQSRVTFNLTPPDSNGLGFFTTEASIEIINKSSGTSFTSGGINGFTTYYASF
jgi:hypothetical protein